MSNLVTIPAEALRWCPIGFEIFLDGTRYLYERRLERKDGVHVCWCSNADYAGFYALDTVQVDSAKYEAAVVAVIREMMPLSKIVRKSSAAHHLCRLAVVDKVGGIVSISADPRPWEDEYTIKIEGE
ncbi:MAG: hypothetical protein GY941_22430 [Planctomycetes bacterium]|nr:hypothetical protein [Planctomycetota bacterium]